MRVIYVFIQSPEYEEYLKSCLPDNFTWMVNYLSSTIDVSFSDLYFCLVSIEKNVQEIDPGFFGSLHKASSEKNRRQKQKNENNFLQDRLC
jgi:hypothetical protein